MTVVISLVVPMARLSPSDLGQALNLLREAEEVAGPDPFPTELLDRFRELIGCDCVSYCELDRPHGRVLLLDGCARAREVDAEPPVDSVSTFWRLRHQHPVCAYQDRTGDFSALKLSDFLTLKQLHELEIYRDYFRPFGVEYELDVGLPAPPTHTKVFLFERSTRDFTERERLLLDLLRPHLVSLYAAARDRRTVAALQNCEHSPQQLVVPGRDGSVDFAGPEARQLLRRYFGRDAERSLPEALRDWVRWEGTRLNGHGPHPLPGSPLTFDRGNHRLVVRRVGDVLLLQEDVASLTPREREILGLVAQGCSNADIAAGLWISPGTVRIHLQHIYEKLGVGSRTAAVARAGQVNRIETV
jgi:DNA-binding CsgD family transcriptional regulator